MKKPCPHCDGKGYIELRDCAGDVQREETCVFCEGLGEIEIAPSSPEKSNKKSNEKLI